MIRLTVFADHDLKHSLAGGANVNLQENLKRLSDKIKITLLCTWEPGLPEREVVDGIEILRFKGNMFTVRMKIPRYYKKHLEETTDIVWDTVDFSVPWLTPLFTRKPIVMHCLHFQKKNFFYELPFWKAAGAYFLEPYLYRLYKNQTIVPISESTKESLLEIGIAEEKIHVISPGLDPGVFSSWDEIAAKKSSAPVLVSLARLRAWKGVQFAILAMGKVVKKIPETRLYIIGTGPYENELHKLTKNLNLEDNVFFLGRVGENEKLDWLKKAHLLTKTSVREGWGIDVLEANACGTPAIGWDVPGTKDSIQHEKTGFVVPFGDVEKLSERICSVLGYPALKQRLSMEAFRVSKQFTWDASAAKIAEILEQLAAKN